MTQANCENCKILEEEIENKDAEIQNLQERLEIAQELLDDIADSIKDCLSKI